MPCDLNGHQIQQLKRFDFFMSEAPSMDSIMNINLEEEENGISAS